MGQSSQKCLNIIEELMGVKPPPDLESRYQKAIAAALTESVTCINGIEQALVGHFNTILCCIGRFS